MVNYSNINFFIRFLIVLILMNSSQYSNAQQISFSSNIEKIVQKQSGKFSNQLFDLKISICQNEDSINPIFSEYSTVNTDNFSDFTLKIGSGKKITGNINEINWSDGSFQLVIESDTVKKKQPFFKYFYVLRIPTELHQDNLEGTVIDEEQKGWGHIRIANPKKKSPKKITIDLSTQYVNIAYPADTYPIYRHFEWFDLDGNGIGNSLMLTFSEKTKHEFFENVSKLGEVKLYAKPFQELLIKGLNNSIELLLTKPEEITNLNQTYAIKGPWKLIYYIEW